MMLFVELHDASTHKKHEVQFEKFKCLFNDFVLIPTF